MYPAWVTYEIGDRIFHEFKYIALILLCLKYLINV